MTHRIANSGNTRSRFYWACTCGTVGGPWRHRWDRDVDARLHLVRKGMA